MICSEQKPLHLPTTHGGLPDGWGWSRLDDVCEGVFDCPHSTPKLTNVGPFVVRTQDIITGIFRAEQAARVSEQTYHERTSRVEPQRGDLLYSREGTYFGIAAEIPERTRICLGQRMVLIRPSPKKLDFRFLRYWLNSPIMASHIHGYRDGSVAERLNLPTIRALPILCPPVSEQREIARILRTLDDKIELNRRMNATLEAMARALFQSWFVDFDPVRAKLDGRSPPGLDKAAAALFPAHFQESPIGSIPQGWKIKPMSEVIEVNPRRILKSGVAAPYLDMKNMPTQGHAADEIIEREFNSGTKFQNGDALLARITPCLENGKTAFVDFLHEGQIGWGSTEYIVFAPKPPLTPEFCYYLARSDALRLHAIQNMTGTSGRQRVPSDCFHQFKLAVPSAEIAARFGEITRPWMKKIHANTEQSRTLAALRDSLLPKLLSGEISASGLELEKAK
jgi:type I restriction enzyme, S subunit